MPHSTFIELHFLDGTPEGIKYAEIKGKLIRAIALPVSKIEEMLTEHRLNQPGIYMFVRPESAVKGVQHYSLYIGQSGTLFKRITEQLSEKLLPELMLFWDGSGQLNGSDVLWLEGHLINLAKTMDHIELINRNNSSKAQTSFRTGHLEEFSELVKLLAAALGYPIFRNSQFTTEQSTEILHLTGKGAKASAKVVDQIFTVLAGATLVSTETPTCPDGVRARRSSLVEQGKLKQIDDQIMQLTEDTGFNSPSQAAGVILGRSANGNVEWKTSEGIEFGLLKRKQSAPQ